MTWHRTRHKYNAKKVEIDGIKFDSKAEARRYGELRLLEKAGKIEWLEVHPAIELWQKKIKICKVILDFKYLAPGKAVPEWRYEDVKGFDTPISRLKRKLLLALCGIDVEVIKR